jgi:hypothetical protein
VYSLVIPAQEDCIRRQGEVENRLVRSRRDGLPQAVMDDWRAALRCRRAGLRAIEIVEAGDRQADLATGRQAGVVDDPAGANEGDRPRPSRTEPVC